MNRARWLWAALLLICFWLPGFASADERILDFNSDITVDADGSMMVEETIQVRAEGLEIHHGIFRDFPLSYRDSSGLYHKVDFRILQVMRDGHPEPYHTVERSNGIRIYMGDKNTNINPGVYRYTLIYDTARQLGFFPDHDELYWNVTGNGWSFPIDRASAIVNLPLGIPKNAVRLEAYTGAQGAKGTAYRAWMNAEGQAEFETTQPLPRHAGLTIVASWPKGFVHEPTTFEKLGRWLSDNQSAFIAGGGLVTLLGYFLFAWFRVGRDPEAGVIIPHYLPPDGLSPATLRFVRNMGYDNKAFSSAIVGLAAKGYFKIDEQGGKYTLERQDNPSQSLTPSEAALNSELSKQPKHFELKQDNHSAIQAARKAHEKALRREYESENFRLNSAYLWFGVAILLVSYALGLLVLTSTEDKSTGLFMSAWLSVWTLGVYMLTARTLGAWRQVFHSPGKILVAIGVTAFALPFIAGELFGLGMLIHAIGSVMALLLVSGIVLSVLFHHLLKAPTLAGRKLLDRIEGFRLYLSVAEASDLKMTYTPKLDKQMFESYLPYAMALDVEDAWSHRFEQSLAVSGESPSNYTGPTWYGSYGAEPSLTGMGSTFTGSLTSSIIAAGTAPGSSSGSSGSFGGGGGGSSGGGGGGGGGGGW